MRYIIIIFCILAACSPYDLPIEEIRGRIPSYPEGCTKEQKTYAQMALFMLEGTFTIDSHRFTDEQVLIYLSDFTKPVSIRKYTVWWRAGLNKWRRENKDRVDRCTPLLIGEKETKPQLESNPKEPEREKGYWGKK
jgi:hypothetical protein